MKKVFKRIGKAVLVALIISKVIDGFAFSGIVYDEEHRLSDEFGYYDWLYLASEESVKKAVNGWKRELRELKQLFKR